MSSNVEIFNHGMQQAARIIEDNIFDALDTIATELMNNYHNEDNIPVVTGNLADSTGIGIYMKGSLIKYIPNQIAEVPRVGIFGVRAMTGEIGISEEVWGANQLDIALDWGDWYYNDGIWLVLFSTMPYAIDVDLRTSFFQDFESELRDYVISKINSIK